MKPKSLLLIAILVVALLLSGCGTKTFYDTPSAEGGPPVVENKMNKAWNAAALSEYPSVLAEHGEDGVIVWEDPGMEGYIRLALGKPEGDILRSEVWDIQVLAQSVRGAGGRIGLSTVTITDPDAGALILALNQPVHGSQMFNNEPITLSVQQEKGIYSDKNARPPRIESLADLRHFDSLQYLSIEPEMHQPGEKVPLDLSGLEKCVNLKCLYISNSKLIHPEILGQLSQLNTLSLSDSIVDLPSLKNNEKLREVSLYACQLNSLEPLTDLTSLKCLSIRSTDYPSLEPLTRTSVEYLNLGGAVSDRGRYKGLDYEPLTQMSGLVWLSVENHAKVDYEIAQKILLENTNLKYLDIGETNAAKRSSDLLSDQLEALYS